MDELRARAFLDLLLGKDSRPRRETTAGGDGPDPARPDGPPPAEPGGFAGRVNLTAPLATLTNLASRPGTHRTQAHRPRLARTWPPPRRGTQRRPGA